MAITADGNFLPCNFIQATLGNIRDKSLRTMRDDLLRSPWFSQKHACCILGEDSEYIKQFVLPHAGKKKPLDAYQLFELR